MKKEYLSTILYGIGITLVWSAVFVSALHNWAGIGIGIAFGVCFTTIFVSNKNKKDTKTK